MHLRSAILCPGPSLAVTYQSALDWADIVICVNRAINILTPPLADWLVMGDSETVGTINYDGMYGLCIPSALVPYTDSSRPSYLWSELSPLPNPQCECNYSVVAAHALALELGSTDVALYGADMTGRAEFDGNMRFADTRSDERWRKESIELHAIMSYLNSHGVTTSKISPGGKKPHG